MRRLLIANISALTVFGALLFGCDSLESPLSENNRYVVESYHEVGKPLGNVRLSSPADLETTYSPDAQGITGAEVQVSLLSASGGTEKTFPYRAVAGSPGVYEPIAPDLVLGERTYQLRITHPNIPQTIEATTYTPSAFEIVRPGLDEVVYEQAPQFELGVTRSTYPGRQTIFMFSVESLNPDIDSLTSLYDDIIDPQSGLDDGLTEEEVLQDYVIIESQPVNEGNYEVQSDETINVKLPWFAVAFYGPNRISMSAIDENLYDYFRSQAIQQGGSTLSPGEIPNIIDRIDGATGVFGSYSRVTQNTYIARQ